MKIHSGLITDYSNGMESLDEVINLIRPNEAMTLLPSKDT